MPFVNVFISRVSCRDRETIEGKDHFGVAGATIIDGEPNVFVMPAHTITRNEQIRYWPNTLYDGYSNTLRIGLSVLAWDIDNNDQWAKNRDDAKKISTTVATIVGLLPVPGADVAAGIVAGWPKAVDFFVDLDENDELVQWSGYVDFPLPAPNQSNYTEYELQFSREDPTGYAVGITPSSLGSWHPILSHSRRAVRPFELWLLNRIPKSSTGSDAGNRRTSM